MIKSLLLSHTSGNVEQVLKKAAQEGEPVYWMFLCQNYVQSLTLQKELGDKFKLIELYLRLSETAEQLRKPYLELITELGRQYKSPAWWSSRISERNTMVSFLFLYCCYLRVAEEQISNLSGTLCIVSESWDVLESLEKLAEKRNCIVKWFKRPAAIRRRMVFGGRIVARILISAARLVRAKMLGHDSPPKGGDAPSVFIHTYVDEDCFGAGGIFHDRYFPGLSEWLEKKDYVVTTIPVLVNIKRSYFSAWKWFRKSQERFINPYRYYRISDYLFAIKESWKQLSMPDDTIMLDGMDVTNLFKAEGRYRAFGDISTLLYFRLPKRLVDAGFRVDVVIAEYENMVNEKLLIMGFRNYLPSVKIVGFQHGALYPLLLCNLVTQKEAEFAPLPDRVVCNGEFFRDVLVREGLPQHLAVVGPALRYAYLWDSAAGNVHGREITIDVFVPLPMMVSDGVELLTKLVHSFREMGNLRIVLKSHPMTPVEVLLKVAGIESPPSHFKFVQGRMSDWLPMANVAVALSSCTIYEMVAFGVPVVVVGREAGIDLNPLGFYADLSEVFYSPHQIRAETLRLLSLSEKELSEYKRRGEALLHTSFNPVNDETMKVFIEGLI